MLVLHVCLIPGRGPFPAVLDLYTFGGGLSEKRASLLASRGFLVLTVALYGHDDLPKNVKEIHLDYLEEAVEFLQKQTKVSSFILENSQLLKTTLTAVH